VGVRVALGALVRAWAGAREGAPVGVGVGVGAVGGALAVPATVTRLKICAVPPEASVTVTVTFNCCPDGIVAGKVFAPVTSYPSLAFAVTMPAEVCPSPQSIVAW
jgi:hypothetical protein